MTRTLITLLPVVLCATACYDPDLGKTPFRCANTGKLCPDDYTCNTETMICEANGATLDSGIVGEQIPPGDGGPSKQGPVFLDGFTPQSSESCVDKDVEPNNSGDTATPLPSSSGIIPGWQICYPGDVDQYAVELGLGDRLAVKVKFFHKNGDLDAALVDPDGSVISQSRSETDDEEIGVSSAAVAGTYVIGVYGFGNATNTYDLELTF